uniref:6-phosphogluconolactonase n=1 Tax=Xenopsylla cheopis TaxID=163159 RepID=A0A6M2DDI4_XENCH
MANRIIAVEDQTKFVETLCSKIQELASESISERNRFTVGLSGGSLIDLLSCGLPSIETDWSKWYFLLCDERIVSENDKESTAGQYKAKLFSKINITEKQFLTIDPELSPSLCADSYRNKIKSLFPEDDIPKIDLLLLGLGPDGHTCSLFPGHPILHETDKWVVGIDDSPKLPPKRITLTFKIINNARTCLFPISGKGKAEMVKRILEDKEDFPAGLVKPKGGAIWMLDKEAAALLKC